MAQNVTLSAKQRRLLTHLASGATIVAASERTGVSRRQIYRWLDDADFAGALADAQRSIFERAMRRLQALAQDAGDELGLLLKDRDPRIRLRAAKIIVDCGRRWDADAEQRERLEAIERAIEAMQSERDLHAV